MHPDADIAFGDLIEERLIFWLIERLASDVGEDLDAAGAQVGDRPDGFLGGLVGIIHGERRDESRETLGMLSTKLGHSVVGEPRDRGSFLWPAERFNGRRGQRYHLAVFAELVHDFEARI